MTRDSTPQDRKTRRSTLLRLAASRGIFKITTSFDHGHPPRRCSNVLSLLSIFTTILFPMYPACRIRFEEWHKEHHDLKTIVRNEEAWKGRVYVTILTMTISRVNRRCPMARRSSTCTTFLNPDRPLHKPHTLSEPSAPQTIGYHGKCLAYPS